MAIYKDLRYKVGVTIGAASSGASQVLLKKVTATSGDSNITFDSSLITNSFKEYIFTFISMHPANDNVFYNLMLLLTMVQIIMLQKQLHFGEHKIMRLMIVTL